MHLCSNVKLEYFSQRLLLNYVWFQNTLQIFSPISLSFFITLSASNDAGCFGKGFPVLQEQTSSVLYNNSAKEDIIKTTIDSDVLSVPAFQFVKIPAVYSFRIIVWNGELQTAYFDHILDLRETSSSGSSLVGKPR